MITDLILRRAAENDIDAAVAWYSAESGALAAEFLDHLDELMLRIHEAPLQFPEVRPGLSRALMRRFPYGVFFGVNEDNVIVYAVLHLHRNPRTWRSRRR